jgi:tetratricopeptide (TPR) repeat protein
MDTTEVLPRKPLRWLCWHTRVAAVIMGFLAIASPAHADTTSGRLAYERGDYQRAMEEWQAAADHNDPEAEFGIGTLYEFGAGELKQDYKRAADWYKRAATHGNTGAEYRLALIYAAGGEDFEGDFVEAYKWASLAAQSEGVWGTLAADLVKQLEQVTTIAQQADAIKRAADWSEARAPKNALPTARAIPAVVEDTSPRPTNSGCPGWPFPTLPCTDRFPALESQAQLHPIPTPPTGSRPTGPDLGIQPALAASSSLDQLDRALKQIDCAALRTRISGRGWPLISGAVPDSDQKAKVVQLAARFFPGSQPTINVDVVPAPLCQSLVALNALGVTGLLTEGSLGLRLNNGSSQLRESDPIKLEVKAPAYAIDLLIDYFSVDGQVLHLIPAGGEAIPRMAARETRLFGSVNGQIWKAGGAPFGTELISVIGTPVLLDLGSSRPQVEPAADYLRDLKRAFGRSSPEPGHPAVVATVLVTTAGAGSSR